MVKIIDVYTLQNQYIHSFKGTDETIADYVANLSVTGSCKLVDPITDFTVLTTIGNFLDWVPNQHWLEETFRQLLVSRQRGEIKKKEVITFNKYN